MKKKETDMSQMNSMVTSFEDMERLGRQMERQRTNEELQQHERSPDPVQYSDAEDTYQ